MTGGYGCSADSDKNSLEEGAQYIYIYVYSLRGCCCKRARDSLRGFKTRARAAAIYTGERQGQLPVEIFDFPAAERLRGRFVGWISYREFIIWGD